MIFWGFLVRYSTLKIRPGTSGHKNPQLCIIAGFPFLLAVLGFLGQFYKQGCFKPMEVPFVMPQSQIRHTDLHIELTLTSIAIQCHRFSVLRRVVFSSKIPLVQNQSSKLLLPSNKTNFKSYSVVLAHKLFTKSQMNKPSYFDKPMIP